MGWVCSPCCYIPRFSHAAGMAPQGPGTLYYLLASKASGPGRRSDGRVSSKSIFAPLVLSSLKKLWFRKPGSITKGRQLGADKIPWEAGSGNLALELDARVLGGSSAAENRNHVSTGAVDRGHLPPGHGSPLCTPVSEVRSREGCPCAVLQFPPCVRNGGRLE